MTYLCEDVAIKQKPVPFDKKRKGNQYILNKNNEITWNISLKVEKAVIKYCARSSHQRKDWRHRHFWIDLTALENLHKNKSKQNLQEEVATVRRELNMLLWR